MKRIYKNLEYEVVRFEKEDVITASGGDNPCVCFDVKVIDPPPCSKVSCRELSPICDAVCECIVFRN